MWWSENPRRTYDSSGKKRVVVDTIGGGPEKSTFTLVLGGTSVGLLYPPVIILPGLSRTIHVCGKKCKKFKDQVEHKRK